MLRNVYLALIAPDVESAKLMRYINAALHPPSALVVDVGCGYGRHLRAMRDRGIDAVGVDVNADIVKANRTDGLTAMTPDEFFASGMKARVMLMAHVIEHFPPRELVEFMNRWLDRLEPGGELIIATPLMSPHFYDDFDHVKPYHPDGLRMVFGGGGAQVQYWSKHRLTLVDIAFRRSPWRATLSRAIYRGGFTAWPSYFINVLSGIAFRASFGLFGRKTGWIGRFRKVAE